MILPQRVFHKRFGWWLAVILPLLSLATECNRATLPLPTASTGSTVRIALLAPNSGELATVGRVMRNGTFMAFDEWNNRGGTLNHRLEGVLYDTDCTFESSQRATQQALDDGLQFFIGPICPEAAIATASLAPSAQALAISPAATHPLVTVNHQGRTRAGIFRVSYSYALQGQAAAHFAYNWLEVSKVALLSRPGDDYSTELADIFARHFSAEGGEIVYRATYTSGDIDFTETLIAINQSGAELLYLPASPSVANQVARQLNELSLSNIPPSESPSLILLGSDSWASDELDLTTVARSYFPIHFSLEANRPLAQRWSDRYKSIYAIEPSTLAVLGYDAVNILIEAIEQTGTLEPQQVARTLEQSTFKGVTGQITFDHQHNPIKPVPFVQVVDGQLIYITSVDKAGD